MILEYHSHKNMATDKRSFFDLRKQFIFYASYHNDTTNMLIHICCIWPILITALALFQYTPSFIATPSCVSSLHPLLQHVSINFPLVITLVYVVSYVLMDPIAGGLGATLVFASYLGTGILVKTTSSIAGYPLFQVLLGYHVFLWIIQFIGHGVFEKRAPALINSWDQAFITAPLFVLLEIMFLFGYKKEFYKECMVHVEKNVAEFKKIKAT